jgi:hypothetical protein
VIVLLSGGLDSLLTAKLLQRQGVAVRCWHAFSPFFGKPEKQVFWREKYGLDVYVEDVGEAFAAMLRQGPAHGFGKVLNPCVDCKIHLLRRAAMYMKSVGARALATGEVIGQRPMSQRRDVMRVIMREAGVTDILVRPLCAQLLESTLPEREGIIDRSRLAAIAGRGRGGQISLAARLGVTEFPTPGGGCRLTERENARRYWPILTRLAAPAAADFALANLGRQFWGQEGDECYWLCVGRNQADNERLALAARPDDALLNLWDMPGPMALARGGEHWPEGVMRRAAALTAACSPKALAAAPRTRAYVEIRCGEYQAKVIAEKPERVAFFENPPPFDMVRAERKVRFSQEYL